MRDFAVTILIPMSKQQGVRYVGLQRPLLEPVIDLLGGLRRGIADGKIHLAVGKQVRQTLGGFRIGLPLAPEVRRR